jgi:hypothetical protein
VNNLTAALLEVSSLLERLSVPHMLIGGLAVALWGEPRATLDVDFTIWVDPQQMAETILELCRHVRCLPDDPVAFVNRTRVLPAMTSQEAKVDIIFAAWPDERRMIARAQPKQANGKTIMVASVEDLVFMKLASERPKDIEDSRLLVRRYKSSIDRNLSRAKTPGVG